MSSSEEKLVPGNLTLQQQWQELSRLDALRAEISIRHDNLEVDDDAFEASLEACSKVLDQIAEVPATSLVDLTLKAAAINWSAKLFNDETYTSPTNTEVMIMKQLISGLLSETANGHPVEIAPERAEPDDAILSAYYEWKAAREFLVDLAVDDDDTTAFEVLASAERKVMDQIPATARGMAIQTLVYSSFGDFSISSESKSGLLPTLEVLARVERPRDQPRQEQAA